MAIKINGRTYTGDNVTIIDNKVFIDGNLAEEPPEKTININIDGNVQLLDVKQSVSSVKIKGDVGSAKTISGDIEIEGDVAGNATTVSGDIVANQVLGSCSTVSGYIHRD